MKRLFSVLLSLGLAFALQACNSNSSPGNTGTNGGPAAAAASGTCAWPLVSNADLANVAFPDKAATYWVTELPYVPGTRIRIEGGYPDARYFSFNVYDSLLRPTDALTDFQIAPASGGNPYSDPQAQPGGKYVAYIIPGTVADPRAANTLYAGSMALPGGSVGVPNPRISMIYRVYLGAGDRQGGVPLPRLTLETADGATQFMEFASCEPLPPNLGASPLNDLMRENGFPPQAAVLPYPLAADQPQFVRFYGLPETVRLMLNNAVGRDVPITALTAGDGGGFLSNRDNAYVAAQFTRERGQLYVVRARAPTWGGVSAAGGRVAPAPPQLRYWSLCSNEFFTQRYVDCLADHEVPLDAQGYFTVVVSDPAARPANAVARNGVAWLPWGAAYYDSVLIYRHMLPDSGFAEAIQNVPFGTPPQDVMHEYYPLAAYCNKTIVESAGNSAANIFAACRMAAGL